MTSASLPPAASPLLDHSPASLPARSYYDPTWFELEQRLLWPKTWIYAGRVAEFVAGTLNRRSIAGENLMVVCDDTGHLRAFHNTCRHRGSELCVAQTQSFNGKLIRCPYHAWAYSASGALVSTAFGTPSDDFTKADHALFPVALKVWNGFVFLCLADEAPAFEPDLGTEILNNWPMNDLVVGHVFQKRLACNWKVFWENYNECLHCPGVHPVLSQRVPIYQQGLMAPNEARSWSPSALPAPALGDGAETWTVSGKLCGPPFTQLTEQERAEAHTFVTLYPSLYLVAHADYVRAVTVIPISPEETLLRAEWLFLPDTLAQSSFDVSDVTDFATQVMKEDGEACEINQRGLKSSKFTHGRLMPEEFDVYGFQQWVLSFLPKDTEAGFK